jgi:vacuolar-type H+-ATPase subunit H
MRGNDRPDERRKLEDTTAARLAEIVAAAEGAAKQVIDDAEAEAQRQLSDADAEAQRLVAERIARVAAVADRLAEGAEAIKRQSDELLAELRRAKQELGVESAGPAPGQTRLSEPASEIPSRKSHLTAVTFVENGASPQPTGPSQTADPYQPTERSQPTEPPQPSGPYRPADPPEPVGAKLSPEDLRTPAGARLLATQMAVSGASREEIEQKLRSGFEIEDTAPILDAILGPELPSTGREQR